MTEKAIRIGMVGTGGMGQAHLESLAKIPEAHVVALCDADEERVKAAANPLGAATYTDPMRMIAGAEMDALYVCVPPYMHGEIEVQAAKMGLHLFVEKPVNLSLAEARRASEAIREAGIITQAGYQLRYLPNSVQLKAFLADKPVATAHVYRWSGLPGGEWWGRYDRSGGQLVEMTTHQVDLLRWVMGEVEAVSASYSFNRLSRDREAGTVPESQAVLLHFASGASATINTSCALGQAWKGDLSFVIQDALVTLQGDGIKVEPEGVYPVPPLPAETPGADEMFVRAVATGDRSLLRSPYDDALRTLAVTLAANQSAKDGGELVRMKDFLGTQA